MVRVGEVLALDNYHSSGKRLSLRVLLQVGVPSLPVRRQLCTACHERRPRRVLWQLLLFKRSQNVMEQGFARRLTNVEELSARAQAH